MLLEKSGHKASQTPIHMATNAIIFSQLSNLFNWVNDAMRIVRIRSIKTNGIGVDQRFHMTDVGLEFIVQLGFTNLNVKVHAPLVKSSMYCVGNNSI
jgi:hypothetical protein